jgi:hypothetical protein
VTIDHALSRDVVKEEQDKDKFCKQVTVGRARGTSEYFYGEDGIIFRRKNQEHQLIVPKSLVKEVIQLSHSRIFASHPGRNRKLDLMCFRLYWPAMRKDVENYVQNCDECQHSKPRHEYRAALEVREPTRPFEVTAMDICGPFNLTPSKNRYVLMFICHCSKYAEAAPIPDMTAETRARAYTTHIIAKHGAGSELFTDQGKNFTSVLPRGLRNLGY